MSASGPPTPSDFERGLLLGILLGEGHFGGDGKQPHITLRMHTRHEALFRWLTGRFPQTKLYGPYNHGGRSYYQWMARGRGLVEEIMPILEDHLSEDLDAYARDRFDQMRSRYPEFFASHDH